MRLVTSVRRGYADLLALMQWFNTRCLHRACLHGIGRCMLRREPYGNTTCKTCKTPCWARPPAFKFRVLAPLVSPWIPQAKILILNFSNFSLHTEYNERRMKASDNDP